MWTHSRSCVHASSFIPRPAVRGAKRRLSTREPLVTWDTEDHPNVANLVLNNPKKLNMLTVELGEEFKKAVKELKKACITQDIRSVVLYGAGDAFSAGGDTSWLMRRHDDRPENNSRIMMDFYKSFLCLRWLPVPVIAAVRGPAIGAGMCLAAACDIRVASASAKFGVTFVSLGIHPGMAATHFLPTLIGPQAAKRLLLTGETITGAEAFEMGFVAEVTEDGDVIRRAQNLAERIAANSPTAVQACMRTLRMSEDEHLEHALQREADAQAVCYNSKDMLEGLLAVKERRSPNFSKSL